MEVKKITGELFRSLVVNGCENLRANYEYIDKLNVFPVPDGDTGTNMRMTIEGGVNEVRNVHEENIYDMSKKISRGMLMGARGNSGVILSQLFRGICKGFEGKLQADAIRLARALQRGVEQAYKAVMNPVEGTILTVAKDGAARMNIIANSKMTINVFFREYLAALKESLATTPELLPVLKEAGVVDSGAAGFVVIVEGMLKYLEGEIITPVKIDDRLPTNLLDEKEFADAEFGYCTEFIMQLNKEGKEKEFSEEEIAGRLDPLGNSLAIVKDENIVKVHIHTLTPGEVLNIAQEYGEFINLKIENMKIQKTHAKETKHVAVGECPCGEEHYEKPVKPAVRKKYSIVSVASGEGLESIFRALGSDVIISGGQSMNPSTEDFIRAFDTLNSDYIIVFPNNKNIILAADQAAKFYADSKVIVIETKSLSEGYTALTMIDLNMDPEEIAADMIKVISSVVSAQITYSVRDTSVNGLKISKGDFIGLLNGKIVTSRRLRYDAVKDLLRRAEASQKDALTIIYGKDASLREVNNIERHVEHNYGNLETEIINGGQDIYSYIFVLE